MKAKKDNRSTSSVSPTKEMFDSAQYKDMAYQVPAASYDHGISGYKPNDLAVPKNYLEHSNGYGVTDPHMIQYYKGV